MACSISEVTETCLHGLMSLLSHKDGEEVTPLVLQWLYVAVLYLIYTGYACMYMYVYDSLALLRMWCCEKCSGCVFPEAVVGESVVVIKKLLQLHVS